MPTRAIAVLPVFLSFLVVGCAGGLTSDDGESDADFTAAGALQVHGPTAERLIAAFDLLEAAEHAMGGRASVDARKVHCHTQKRGTATPSDPMFEIPTTECTLERSHATPPKASAADPAAKARALYEALDCVPPAAVGGVDVGFVSHGMGKGFANANVLSCKGKVDDGLPVATCTGTGPNGAFSLDGESAQRIAQAFDLVEAMQHQMGGRFNVEVKDLACTRHMNTALDPAEPLFQMAQDECTMNVTGKTPSKLEVKDAAPRALALFDALEDAGLPVGNGGDAEDLVAATVKCRKGPGQPTRCAIRR